MKIGIITFNRAHNYGAVLQAYALQEYIRQLGEDVEIIDYCPYYFRKQYDTMNVLHQVLSTSPIRLIRNLFRYQKTKKRFYGFEKFIQQMHLSLKQYNENSYITGYDVVIYGSDQIWNPTHTHGFDNILWGYNSSIEIKKIAYAASMASSDISSTTSSYIRNALQNFDAISVRENTLKNELSKLSSSNIHLVLDPTLIVNPEVWYNYIPQKVNGNYILVYQVRNSSLTLKMAKKYAKEYNCEIIELSKMATNEYRKGLNQTATPWDFVSLVKNAKMVFTTSFHGTAFSLIFRKDFYTIHVDESVDERSKTLLNQLGLSERLIKEEIKFFPSINYDELFEEKFRVLVKESQSYLKESIYAGKDK